MGEIKFMKGNEALAEAAIRAGLQGYLSAEVFFSFSINGSTATLVVLLI